MSQLVAASATPLENVPGLGEGLIQKLNEAGITTVEALADMTPEQLEAIEGIGPKTVEKISLAVNNYFSSLEGAEAAAAAPEGEASAEEAAPEGVEAVPEEGAQPASEQTQTESVREGDSAAEPTDATAAEPAAPLGEGVAEREGGAEETPSEHQE